MYRELVEIHNTVANNHTFSSTVFDLVRSFTAALMRRPKSCRTMTVYNSLSAVEIDCADYNALFRMPLLNERAEWDELIVASPDCGGSPPIGASFVSRLSFEKKK
jgi:hypothetical protein